MAEGKREKSKRYSLLDRREEETEGNKEGMHVTGS